MPERKKPYITFCAQMGDSLANTIVAPHLVALRKLLEKYCNKHYADNIDEFAPILRVDGEIGYWEFEGLQKLRLMKKLKYITVDIGMPRPKWQQASFLEIRKYLFENLKLALEAFVKKLKMENILVDDMRLFEDLSKVATEYLKNPDKLNS
jgi:hypothetical protein